MGSDEVHLNRKRKGILQLTWRIIFYLRVLLGIGHVNKCQPVGESSVRSGKKGVRLNRKAN